MGKVVINVHKLASRANQDVLQAFTIAGDGDLGQVLRAPLQWQYAFPVVPRALEGLARSLAPITSYVL